jgi:hypothetical protein
MLQIYKTRYFLFLRGKHFDNLEVKVHHLNAPDNNKKYIVNGFLLKYDERQFVYTTLLLSKNALSIITCDLNLYGFFPRLCHPSMAKSFLPVSLLYLMSLMYLFLRLVKNASEKRRAFCTYPALYLQFKYLKIFDSY